jgi:hypothetical protein
VGHGLIQEGGLIPKGGLIRQIIRYLDLVTLVPIAPANECTDMSGVNTELTFLLNVDI